MNQYLSNQEKINLQKEWPSKAQFCMKGKVMQGTPDDKWIFRIAFSLFLIISAIFFGFLGEPVWNDLHPSLIFIGILLFISSAYQLVTCRYSDPGVLVRGNLETPKELVEAEQKEQQRKEQIVQNYQEQQERQYSQIQQELQKVREQQDAELNVDESQQQQPTLNGKNQDQGVDFRDIKTNVRRSSEEKITLENNTDDMKEPLNKEHKVVPSSLKANGKTKQQSNTNANQNSTHDDGKQEDEMYKNLNTLRIWTERYCKTCKIMRPPRASHCSHCDQCVTNFDHHCYIVGNCIGERNLKHFILMLVNLTIFIVYLLSLSIAVVQKNMENYPEFFKDFSKKNDFLFITTCITFAALLCVLMCQHLQYLQITFLVVGVILFIAKSIVITSDQPELDFFDNPGLGYMIIIILIAAGFYIVPVCLFNCYNATHGYTLKEVNEISKEDNHQSYYNVGCRQRMKNLYSILCTKSRKSDILI